MKKLFPLALVLLLIFCTSIPAFAATPRYATTESVDIRLYTVGSTVYCELTVVPFSGSTRVSGYVSASRSGASLVGQSVSSTGKLSRTFSLGSASGNYSASFSGTCGSDSINISASLPK